MEGREIGRATVEIVPTRHLIERCKQRLDGILSLPSAGHSMPISGVLVKGRVPGMSYLDVDGIGRFVIAEQDGDYIGITYIPQIHCHQDFRDWR